MHLPPTKAIQFQRFAPPPELGDDVLYLWALRDRSGSACQTVSRFLPNGCYEFIIDMQASVRQKSGTAEWVERPKAFFAGSFCSYIDVIPEGAMHSLGAVFKPGRAHRFLPFDLSKVGEPIIRASAIHPYSTDNLMEHLHTATDDRHRIAAVATFLASIRSECSADAFIDHMIRQFHSTNGTLRLHDLYASSSYTQRHIRRLFRRRTGLSPKAYLRIFRVDHMVRTYRQLSGKKALTELCYLGGYYDQAHFIRDFKSIAGLSPSSYFSTSYPLAQNFI